MARKSRKNVMLQENTAIPDKEKKVLFKAGLYARLSHEKEENIERGTIETQMELMKNYVKDHEDIVIEEEYYDASFTGTNFERPDFKRMLEDAKTGRMRCCIDALRVIRELNARSSGMKKYDVYEKAITRQRRELEKVNRKFSELYGDYSEHLINESEYLTLKQQYLLKSEALKKEIDNLLVSQNLYSKNYKIDEDWENLINKYLKCRKLNKELADAFVDKVQVFEGGRISVNLVYDDCLEELLQVKNKREGDLNE